MAIARAATLGSFGLVAGLAAAAIFLPDGCAINEAGSRHLREGVPLVTPLLFGMLGLVLSKNTNWALVQSLVALLAWSVVVAVLGTGKPDVFAFALVVLGAMAVAAFALPMVVTLTRDP